jgi:hypothetical protein
MLNQKPNQFLSVN